MGGGRRVRGKGKNRTKIELISKKDVSLSIKIFNMIKKKITWELFTAIFLLSFISTHKCPNFLMYC